ncbi:MAG: hypothetical protein JXO51_09660 [Candidatus Aminicenantes bacterium]|nr:hypothetical protein [Candidatus Aminicenantes bacterium]
MARHAAWFPAYNRGREAPVEALAAWERTLRRLPKSELILLLADNRSRNRLLGKKWTPELPRAPG